MEWDAEEGCFILDSVEYDIFKEESKIYTNEWFTLSNDDALTYFAMSLILLIIPDHINQNVVQRFTKKIEGGELFKFKVPEEKISWFARRDDFRRDLRRKIYRLDKFLKMIENKE